MTIHDYVTGFPLGVVKHVIGNEFQALTPWGNSEIVETWGAAVRRVREIATAAGIQYRTDGGILEPIITTLVDADGEQIDYIVDPVTKQRRFLDFMNRR
jgi:hypothetical protein